MPQENRQNPGGEKSPNRTPATTSPKIGILDNLTAAEQAFIDSRRASGEIYSDQQIALGIMQLRQIGELDGPEG